MYLNSELKFRPCLANKLKRNNVIRLLWERGEEDSSPGFSLQSTMLEFKAHDDEAFSRETNLGIMAEEGSFDVGHLETSKNVIKIIIIIIISIFRKFEVLQADGDEALLAGKATQLALTLGGQGVNRLARVSTLLIRLRIPTMFRARVFREHTKQEAEQGIVMYGM